MSTMIQKRGDTRKIGWRATTDLTDAVVVLKVRKPDGTLVDTSTSVTVPEPGSGIFYWQTDGTLEVGTYSVELQITRDGEVMTAPTNGYATLRIVEDLG